MRVHARERVRADAEPVERLQERPSREGESEAASLEASRRCRDPRAKMRDAPELPEPSHQIQVFEDGEVAKASDSFVSLAAYEDARVAVAEPELSELRVEPRQEARRAAAAVE